MIIRKSALLLAAATLLAAGAPAMAKPRAADPVKTFDTNNDRTLDVNEVKKAASTLFDRIDRDHDGTLDLRELAGRLNRRELAAADPDHDGTLTKDEYLAVVQQRFQAADPDKDGTLDGKEIASRAGRNLLRMLQ